MAARSQESAVAESQKDEAWNGQVSEGKGLLVSAATDAAKRAGSRGRFGGEAVFGS